MKTYLSILIFLAIINGLYSQCETNSETDDCSACEQITDNITLNNGQKYCWSGGTGTVNNIMFQGGRLVICDGILNINGLQANGGGTIVLVNGTLNFFTDLNLQDFTIINYGNINMVNLCMQNGGSNRIFNHASGNINISGTTYLNDNTAIINSGNIQFYDLTIQTSQSPAICQNGSGIIDVQNQFYNNTPNSVSSPSSIGSCISFGNMIFLNQILSMDPDLEICLQSGASYSGDWGNPTILNDCKSCETALPINLINFKAHAIENRYVRINWSTATEINNDYFTIEKSTDAENWQTVTTIKAAGNSNRPMNYQYIDENPLTGISYYRLKQTGLDGNYEYFKPDAVSFEPPSNNLLVYPNPAYETLYISGLQVKCEQLQLFNALGQNVISSTPIENSTQNNVSLSLVNLPQGLYCLQYGDVSRMVYKQ